MEIKKDTIEIETKAGTDVINLTQKVSKIVENMNIKEGQVLLFISGSTSAITTIEFESGVLNDLKQAIERLVPENIHYEHNLRWGDGNGYSHVRASLLGPSLTVPLNNGKMILGTWQQIVLIDFDNRPRNRKILIQITGK
ncbi:MAG: secondary thiamine-phosphate synthase enzyme YjbQ [Thermodesulfobacteriota bacterium]|nr:secondary thiamine-phosphate synthase enzyme YjbQ [Thermodesulfobacteriota bacterium]